MNPNTPDFDQIVLAHAEELLFPARDAGMKDEELSASYREFFKGEREKIRRAHDEGATGLNVAAWRSALIDAVIRDHYEITSQRDGVPPYTLVASGGYGRGLLNPGSDIDIQFLIDDNLGRKGMDEATERIRQFLTMLYDAGFEVGHGSRTMKEAIQFANRDHPTKTALLDARFIAGDADRFNAFETAFFKECIEGNQHEYLKARSEDIRARHRKFGRTAHRKEPHVKLGCGGLRDYHNLIWLNWMLQHSRDLGELVKSEQLSLIAFTEIEAAYEFLMRVRNELHFIQRRQSGDILTLRLQGIVATHFQYPGSTVIKRSEQFMRDYYRHTRNLYQHGTSLMQAFHLEVEEESSPLPIVGALAERLNRRKNVSFDGFVARDGLVFTEGDSDPFAEDPRRMMRFFLHTQQRGLKTSPEIRRLFKEHWYSIDERFQRSRSNRDVFEQILQNRGQVARILRQMHRVGFLGRYLPEFGQLTDLVQHEFYHQYAADEHTLRCIDEVDRILQSNESEEAGFKRIFQDMVDPVGLYVALIMHDTGRAEGVRAHEHASAELASKVCRRLHYTGDRLRMIMFLVDHHLTFWRTATTKDISDPDTIADFAAAVKTKDRLEALYLFTYVDSRGTSDDAWNDWKASLMKNLFVATEAYFGDRQAFEEQFNRPVSKTREAVTKRLDDSYADEIDAHFRILPQRYFNYRGEASITRHIKLFRRFLERVRSDSLDSMEPVIGWEARPNEGYTLMEMACWNRHNLLAITAGALASKKLNIMSADIFMRDDDLVLDIFRVCTPNFSPINNAGTIKRLEKLIEEACRVGEAAEPIDFGKLIEKQAAPSVLDEPGPLFTMPQRVYVTNELNETDTVLEIQAVDRIGLLYDIFSVLSRLDTEVLSARISTQAGAAIDRFHLVDTQTEKKIVDPEKLEAIRNQVWGCLEVAERQVARVQDLRLG